MPIKSIVVLQGLAFWLVKCALIEEANCCITIERADRLADFDIFDTAEQPQSDTYVVIYGKDSAKTWDEYDLWSTYTSIVYINRTSTQPNSKTPTWNEEFCVKRLLHDEFYFLLYNENVKLADDFMGYTDPDKIYIPSLPCNESKEFVLTFYGTALDLQRLFVSVECDYTCGPEILSPGALHVTSVVDESEMMIETKATFTEPE
eukprot:CAMPEP_0202689236 /NCGR_PEP_ID=MMETSP1385-20130828/4546_1 /ASSEMBLY_ACC=CAM_ASM_000861 /TAXON_ID=933848 /ORGANISM="Elphidium margaritaceum" /LENGTH=203 /DNA_ID=CAMNT_0049344341 /DNA_START=89 /DNA_END=697 /DNA_ORIENTATION=+